MSKYFLYSAFFLLLKNFFQYDYDFVKALCIQNNVAPDVSIVVNTLCTTKQELKKELEQCDIVVKESKYYQNVLHLQKTANIVKAILGENILNKDIPQHIAFHLEVLCYHL